MEQNQKDNPEPNERISVRLKSPAGPWWVAKNVSIDGKEYYFSMNRGYDEYTQKYYFDLEIVETTKKEE